MTQENKELLQKDLCARLPYNPICECEWKTAPPNGTSGYITELDTFLYEQFENMEECDDVLIKSIKPYLRPMSSMTEEEFKSLKEFSGLKYDQLELSEWNSTCKTLEFYLEEIPSEVVALVFDWLNAHHFDYRELISKGLALEAPKDVYNTSQKWTPLRSGLKENEDGQIVGGLKL